MCELISPLKSLRITYHMTQGEFAMLLNCAKSFLSVLENGYAKISPNVLIKLADLDVDTKMLVSQHIDFMRCKQVELTEKFYQGKNVLT